MLKRKGELNPITRAENLIPGSSNRAENLISCSLNRAENLIPGSSNRAENLIPGSSNRAENLISCSLNRAEVSARQPGLKFSSCNRKLRFTRILYRRSGWNHRSVNQAESSSQAENFHVISAP